MALVEYKIRLNKGVDPRETLSKLESIALKIGVTEDLRLVLPKTNVYSERPMIVGSTSKETYESMFSCSLRMEVHTELDKRVKKKISYGEWVQVTDPVAPRGLKRKIDEIVLLHTKFLLSSANLGKDAVVPSIKDAKRSFHSGYKHLIDGLGYNLAAGITWNDKKEECILALVQSKAPIPKAAKKKIEDYLPTSYSYQGHDFDVIIRYAGVANPR